MAEAKTKPEVINQVKTSTATEDEFLSAAHRNGEITPRGPPVEPAELGRKSHHLLHERVIPLVSVKGPCQRSLRPGQQWSK